MNKSNEQVRPSTYQNIKDIQSKCVTSAIGEEHLAKCFLMCYLAEELKLLRFVETCVVDSISLLSVSTIVRSLGGKAFGLVPISLGEGHHRESTRVARRRSDHSAVATDDSQLYAYLLEKKIDLDLDETITVLHRTVDGALMFFAERSIQIDLLHIHGNPTSFPGSHELPPLVREGGIIVVDYADCGTDHSLYDSLKRNCTELFACGSFGILQKQREAGIHDLQTRHLQRKLRTSYDNVYATEARTIPTITVGVTAYNIERYIKECLTSIIHQRGNFNQEILVFEDGSTDRTLEKIQEFISENEMPSNMTLRVTRNKGNIGLVRNYQQMLQEANRLDHEFLAIVDGDDYLLDDYRMQAHIDLLNENPELALSFNAWLIYEDDTGSFRMEESLRGCDRAKYTLVDLLQRNFMAPFSVVRGNVVQHVPDELFDMYTADWFLHIYFSQYGDIGYIRKPMSVYRRHAGGNWSAKTPLHNARVLFKAIGEFSRLTDYEYYPYMWDLQKNLYDQPYGEAFEELDLLIIDDVFPHPSSGYRLQEFTSYLEHFDSIRILATGVWTHLLGDRRNEDIVSNYKRLHPETAKKVIGWRGYSFNGDVSCKLAYFCFLGNVFPCIDTLERLRIPFVFELYPGGSFLLNNSKSDQMLRRVFSSPYFRKVIVTQTATYDYLTKNRLCPEDKIVYVFGVVMPLDKLTKRFPKKRHYGFEKKTLDICFVAMKYTKHGEDKGYDIFVQVAKELCKKYPNIKFHVVGGFDEDVLDVSGIRERIAFYGHQPQDWFDQFYRDKDIILSPNLHDMQEKGSFDGFPTAACTDAGLRETAIFCTDSLGMNKGHFADKHDIEIIEHDVSRIVERIAYYYSNPDELLALSKNGSERIRELYAYDRQIAPRIELLEEEILASSSHKEEIERSAAHRTVPRSSRSWVPGTVTAYNEIVNRRVRRLAAFMQRAYVHAAPPNSRRAWLLDRTSELVNAISARSRRRKADLDLLRSSELFNEDWYLSEYPDVEASGIDPAVHYLVYGGAEGRDPGPEFSSSWYLTTYPDVSNANVNPLVHYLRFGRNEGRYPGLEQQNPSESQYCCPICKARFSEFLPLDPEVADNLKRNGSQFTLDDFETLNYRQYVCPSCGASDRDRLYACYLEEKIPRNRGDGHIILLDIAPTPFLSRLIDRIPNLTHHTADLFMENVDFQIDVTEMRGIATETYDVLVCSHVLEHVSDDAKALSELFRVLKPGGWGIIMVPINLAIERIDEDPAVFDEAERWRRFGQNDHVRMYNKEGFVKRVEAAGFSIKGLGIEHFGRATFRQHGIADRSVLYIVEKESLASQ